MKIEKNFLRLQYILHTVNRKFKFVYDEAVPFFINDDTYFINIYFDLQCLPYLHALSTFKFEEISKKFKENMH